MLSEVGQMPTAKWDAYYDNGVLFEGYEVSGEDAVLASLMDAWERIEAAAGDADAQEDAADFLQGVVDALRDTPIGEWRTGCYLSA